MFSGTRRLFWKPHGAATTVSDREHKSGIGSAHFSSQQEEDGRLKAHPASLHLLGGHDDDVRVLLVEHLPEVHHRVLQAALGGDEDFAFVGVPALFVHTLPKNRDGLS